MQLQPQHCRTEGELFFQTVGEPFACRVQTNRTGASFLNIDLQVVPLATTVLASENWWRVLETLQILTCEHSQIHPSQVNFNLRALTSRLRNWPQDRTKEISHRFLPSQHPSTISANNSLLLLCKLILNVSWVGACKTCRRMFVLLNVKFSSCWKQLKLPEIKWHRSKSVIQKEAN